LDDVPPSLHAAIIPLVLGNRWLYFDTLITQTSVHAISYEVIVVSVRRDGNSYWWKLQNRFNPSIASREFMAQGDSIFSLQYADSPYGWAPIASLEYLPPPLAGTLEFRSTFSGDAGITKSVTRLNREHSTPAGTFNGCIVYMYDINPEHYQEIVVPGIGVLSCEIRADSTSSGPAWHRKIVLADYGLAE
jgi:hypothetical protein